MNTICSKFLYTKRSYGIIVLIIFRQCVKEDGLLAIHRIAMAKRRVLQRKDSLEWDQTSSLRIKRRQTYGVIGNGYWRISYNKDTISCQKRDFLGHCHLRCQKVSLPVIHLWQLMEGQRSIVNNHTGVI